MWGPQLASARTQRGCPHLSHEVMVLHVFHAYCICRIKSKIRNVVAGIPLKHGNIWRTKTESKLNSHSINLMKFENKKRHGCREFWVLDSSSECWLWMILRHHFPLTISQCNLSYFLPFCSRFKFMTSGCQASLQFLLSSPEKVLMLSLLSSPIAENNKHFFFLIKN